MNDDFYRAFEERYYAPRRIIKELRRQYHSFIEPLATIYLGAPVFDLGCGRGEWLELMIEAGFSPYGVDLDEGMLRACVELNLPAEKGDAISFIATLPNESQAVISAFHVVEHIPFDELRTLVSEALRVLKPGGLLIMETPNPENIMVSTRNFYLDPTHIRLIPAELLSFVPEYYGFHRVKTLRLQEAFRLHSEKNISLQDVIGGVSPDYAVVAQKQADEEILALTAAVFDKEYGVSLENLVSRFDQNLTTHFNQAETRATEAETRVQVLLNSRSMRLTSPLRWLARQLRNPCRWG